MKITDKEIKRELDKLVKMRLLNKSKEGYIDSELSKHIDTLSPRQAFIEGFKYGKSLKNDGKNLA